jgi:hypothetical protein
MKLDFNHSNYKRQPIERKLKILYGLLERPELSDVNKSQVMRQIQKVTNNQRRRECKFSKALLATRPDYYSEQLTRKKFDYIVG